MRFNEWMRRLSQRFGIDFVRWPEHEPLWHVAHLLEYHKVEHVIDVGANCGEYAWTLRKLGYDGSISSYEPLGEPYRKMAIRASRDGRWSTKALAMGSFEGEVEINVAANSGASSSILPMLPLHNSAAPDAHFVGKERVQQSTLDRELKRDPMNTDRKFLKLDVQGYEKDVLAGGPTLLNDPSLVGLQMEMSLRPLYADAWTFPQALDWASGRSFGLVRLIPGFTDPRSGAMLQCDGVFIRTS